MSGLADFFQILAVSTSFALVVLGVAVGVQIHKFYQILLAIKGNIEVAAEALRNDGKPISVKKEFEGLEKGVVGEVSDIDEALKSIVDCQQECLEGRSECIQLLKTFQEKPYQLCEMFLRCPANKAKTDQYQRLEGLILRKWASDEAAMKEIHERMNHLEEMLLANREIFQTFTGELGVELLRSIKRDRQQKEKI